MLNNRSLQLLSVFKKIEDPSVFEYTSFPENLSIYDRLLLTELIVSSLFFKKNKIEFNEGDCLTEIMNRYQSLEKFVCQNDLFMVGMFNDIADWVNDPQFKTNFNFVSLRNKEYVYLGIILRSLFLVDSPNLGDFFIDKTGLLPRKLVVKNIESCLLVFRFLEEDVDNLKRNAIKILMLLEKYVRRKKITTSKVVGGSTKKQKDVNGTKKLKKKYHSEIFIGFNVIYAFGLADRITINYSNKEYRFYKGFLLASSAMSLIPIVKKCKFQIHKNYIKPDAAIKQSTEPIYINYGLFDQIVTII